MAIVFLIGGTGNQLFQFATSENYDEFSPLFQTRLMSRVLRWKRHERIFQFPIAPKWKTIAYLPLLTVDLLVAKFLGKSLFTQFDLRSVRAEPRYRRLMALGYFVDAPLKRDLAPITSQVSLNTVEKIDVAIHIRGGDLRKAAGDTKLYYGEIDCDYLSRALACVNINYNEVAVHTDDPIYVADAFSDHPVVVSASIKTTPLIVMFKECLGASVFIACNSTLSFWILRLRKPTQVSIAPKEFMVGGNFDIPSHVLRV